MTIKVNVEFSVDETNKESMRTLSRFFSSFEENIESNITSNIQNLDVNPFDEPVKKAEPDNWFIDDNQIDEISKYLEAEKDEAVIEGYVRNYADGKTSHLLSKEDSRDIYKACRCIANEALIGGLRIVGKVYSANKKDRARASVSVKDYNNVYHDISFSRVYNGEVVRIGKISNILKYYMRELGISLKYDRYFGTDHRNKTSVSLPSDVKSEQEQ